MIDAHRSRLTTGPKAMPDSGIGCVSYITDLIFNLETGVWVNNCPQLMPRSRVV
jgi:hypothetical protein